MTSSALATVNPSSLQHLVDLYRAPSSVLKAIMAEGQAPPFEDLLGWEFNGANVGFMPGIMGIRKFRKGFYQGPPRTDRGPEPFIQGYNIPIRQNGVGNPHVAKPSDQSPKRFGFYRVYRAEQNPAHRKYPQALLLDYGLGRNGPTPPALLRDYLVQVHRGSSDLLLGYAVFSLGPIHIPGGFFILERWGKHSFTG